MRNLFLEENFPRLNDAAAVLIDSPGVGSTPYAFEGPNFQENDGPSPIPETRASLYSVEPSPIAAPILDSEDGHAPGPTWDDGVNRDAPPSFGSRPASEPRPAPRPAPCPTFDEGVNHSMHPSSSGSRPFSNSDSTDVYDIRSPVRLKRLGLYANKEALQRHLQMYAINNHFQFKAKVSHKEVLHVVCRDDNCKWGVRAVRLRKTHIFQIKR